MRPASRRPRGRPPRMRSAVFPLSAVFLQPRHLVRWTLLLAQVAYVQPSGSEMSAVLCSRPVFGSKGEL